MTCYMLHKPAGPVCARTDREHPTVMDLMPTEAQRLFPLGRLDRWSEGLLLITDDGRLNRRLLDPERHVEKEYFLWAAGEPSEAAVRAVEGGLRLKGLPAPTLPCNFEILGRGVIGEIAEPIFPIRRPLLDAPDTPVFRARITLREGKRHQIKRMLEAVGCTCLYLRRDRFGPLTLDPALAPGEYRLLTEAEIRQLRAAADCQGDGPADRGRFCV